MSSSKRQRRRLKCSEIVGPISNMKEAIKYSNIGQIFESCHIIIKYVEQTYKIIIIGYLVKKYIHYLQQLNPFVFKDLFPTTLNNPF